MSVGKYIRFCAAALGVLVAASTPQAADIYGGDMQEPVFLPPPSWQGNTLPASLSFLKPDYVYLGSGILDAHVGEKEKFDKYGRPTNQYTGVTFISPFEKSQYNPYPVGPEAGFGWKTPSLASYGIDEVGIGFVDYTNSLYKNSKILGFRFGHELAEGVIAGITFGPIFSGYGHESVAGAAEVEFDLKKVSRSLGLGIADFIPEGFIVKDRILPAKLEFWAPGQGSNAAVEVFVGLKFSL